VSEALATRYRPRRFADVTGQNQSVAALYRMSFKQTLPEAMILHGTHGSGKTTTARIVAAAANCELPPAGPDAWPCGTCASCRAIAAECSPDVLEVDAASNGRVDEIRAIKELVQYQASGRKHIVLLDEAQSMSREAFNAFLKVLEEPPDDTIFVLLTTEPGKILPTVYSRCTRFGFRRLTTQVIAQRLSWICSQEGSLAEPAMLLAIAERADGAMRDAIMLLDQALRAEIVTLDRYQFIMGVTDYGPRLVHAMIQGRPETVFEVLDEALVATGDYDQISGSIVSTLKDILRLQGNGVIAAQGQALAERMQLAQQLDAVRVVSAMRVLWDLRVRTQRAELRSSLELAAVMCMERLHRPAVTPAPGQLSLAQVQGLAG
jgi:DNA polymerase III subunit gamma/tau